MTNGKVRIYDLSKELNLENKDILVICEDLNISVKSHSSTISEEDATRIRASAQEKETQGVVKPAAIKTEKRPNKPEKPVAPKPNTDPKQQILQIRHKNSPDGNAENPSPLPKPPIVGPKQTLANKPTPQRPTSDGVNQQAVTPKAQLVTPPPRPKIADGQKADVVNKPVVSPTPKPQAPIKVEKPTIKQAPIPKGEGTPKPTKSSGPVKSDKADKSSINKRDGREQKERSPRSAPNSPASAIPELNRPPRRPPNQVAKIGIDAELAALDDDDLDIVDTPIAPPILNLKPQRPPMPKQLQAKKAKGRTQDEDEEETAKAKLAPKNKRKSTIIIEDEDDFDDEDDLDRETSVEVSLSIARPPKPKSGSSTKPSTPTPLAKKKPSRGDSQKNDRRRETKTTEEKPESIVLTGSLNVRDLSELLVVPETEIVKLLFFKGIAVSVNQMLDVETATMVAEELGVLVETEEEKSEAIKVTEMLSLEDMDNLESRPPVVTIMGHVDHGKTTLLDAIRSTKVAQGEAGGITQHIGAYHVDVEHEGQMRQVVFLDTPGHEAFTAMRARGARVTDIAILVVAADDGVRPQTIEAIRHAQAAEVPIVVAINKMDKPSAQPERVQQELTEFGMLAEEWGGDTIMVPVSALKGDNLDTLLEMLLLVADTEELSANPNRPARGTVIEAHLDKAKGPVATLIVQNGTLRVGDTLVAGHVFGKVRAMVDDRLNRVEAASPSFAVEVLGLSDVPAAGDEFEVFTEKEARALADTRSEQFRQSRLQQMMASRRVTLNTISAQAQEGELKELNLILKADVQGSVEAILGSLQQLPQNEVQVRVLLAAAGEVTETDVDLAAASGAVIIGFNTTLASGSRNAADEAGVDIREYNIIYKLLDDIQGAMEGLLDPEMVEEPLGQVEVRAVFPVGRGAVAGCYILSGKAIRNCNIRVMRKGQLVYEGFLDSLKRVKDDVKEVNAGFECGIRLDKFNDWQEGDIIETFQMVSKRRTLSMN